jgi:hypothetical protein
VEKNHSAVREPSLSSFRAGVSWESFAITITLAMYPVWMSITITTTTSCTSTTTTSTRLMELATETCGWQLITRTSRPDVLHRRICLWVEGGVLGPES